MRWYCREAGVRSLQRHINMTYNKIALKKVSGEPTPFHITEANLHEYVGKPKYISDRMYDRPPAGVVMVRCRPSLPAVALSVARRVPAGPGVQRARRLDAVH